MTRKRYQTWCGLFHSFRILCLTVRSHCPTPTPIQRPTPTQIMINSIKPIFVGLCIGLFVGQCEHTITHMRPVKIGKPFGLWVLRCSKTTDAVMNLYNYGNGHFPSKMNVFEKQKFILYSALIVSYCIRPFPSKMNRNNFVIYIA